MPNTGADPARVHVVAGVILRDERILVTRRHREAHQGGLWEFPGGKREPGEAPEQALRRELREELGIEVARCAPLLEVSHDYGDKQVLLDVWLVEDFTGEAHGREGQPLRWCNAADLRLLDFPAANTEIVARTLAILDSHQS